MLGLGSRGSAAATAPELSLHGTVPAFRSALTHPTMAVAQGEPALLRVGDPVPGLKLSEIAAAGRLSVELVDAAGRVVSASSRPIEPGGEVAVEFPGSVTSRGVHELRIALALEDGSNVYQSLYFAAVASDAEEHVARQLVYLGDDGRLQYVPDFLGNRIPDFSHAGYGGGGRPIPDIPVKQIVEPGEGDDTARIQAAVDAVAALPADENGFRGAVLLKKGTYEVSGVIAIRASGVVLRGEGSGEDGTLLVATGNVVRDLIRVEGARGAAIRPETGRRITDLYVPVGARSFHVTDASGFQVGDTVVVRRHGNAAWIHEIGMDQLPPHTSRTIEQWRPFHLDFERVITGISGDLITVDAPIVNAIEHEWGGGEVFLVDDGRIEKVGVESLRARSEYNPQVRCFFVLPCDEQHADYLLYLNNVRDAWGRDLVAVNFAHGLVYVDSGAKRVTIEDASSLAPVSLIEGSRRYPFHVLGQLVLMHRVFSSEARHAFVFNARVAGPNVFLHATSEKDLNRSEPHRLWSVGGLYDNVNARIAVQDRYTYGSGHGWAGANFVMWNTTGSLVAQKPPTAQNWAIGHVGERLPGDFLPRTDGYWHSHGTHVEPKSLYLAQLEDRLGAEAVAALGY